MTNVTIYVVPDSTSYAKKIYGGAVSTANDLYINLVNDLYTVVFDFNLFITFNPTKLMEQVRRIFELNLPAERNFNFDIEYIGELDPKYEQFFDEFSKVAEFVGNGSIKPEIDEVKAKELTPMLEIWDKTFNKKQPKIKKKIKPRTEEDNWYEGFIDDDNDDSIDDDEYNEYDPNDFFEGYAYAPKLKKPSHHKKYESSVVWNKSKNIKRSINRHGVVISSKEKMRRDKKLIKKFLREFIPGNAGWKKEFREELAKRWLSVYAISKKNLKELERGYRKKRTPAKSKTAKAVLNLANRVFNEDTWNNPNK